MLTRSGAASTSLGEGIATRADKRKAGLLPFPPPYLRNIELAERKCAASAPSEQANCSRPKTLPTFDFKACHLPLPASRLGSGDCCGGGNLSLSCNFGTGRRTSVRSVTIWWRRTSRLLHPDQRTGARLQAARTRIRFEAGPRNSIKFDTDHPRDNHLLPTGSGLKRRPLSSDARRYELPQQSHIAAKQPFSGLDSRSSDKAMTVFAASTGSLSRGNLEMNAKLRNVRRLHKGKAERRQATPSRQQNEGETNEKPNKTTTSAAWKPAKMVVARDKGG